MVNLILHDLDDELVKIFSEVAQKLGVKSKIINDNSSHEILKLYQTKIQQVRSEKCYFIKDDKFYFIFALYPPSYHYSSSTISKYQGGWYDKKLMTVMAIDDVGNFYYRYPDGSIRYFVHSRQEEITIAKSEKEFLKGIMPISNNYIRESSVEHHHQNCRN